MSDRSTGINWNEFRARWFTPETEALWVEWCKAKIRETGDLIDLLRDAKTRMAYRARALMILLSLEYRWMPIKVYWQPLYPKESYYWSRLDFSELPRELLPLARALTLYWAQDLADREDTAHTEPRWKQDLSCQIYQLMILCPIEEVEPLWPYYELNDATPFSGIDDQSGYRPWQAIMFNHKIPYHWKVKADTAMRVIVQRELDGKAQPRVEWEDAYKCYQGAIDFRMFPTIPREPPYYNTNLLASQIDFLLAAPRAAQRAVIWSLHLDGALRVFREDRFRELRRKIANNALHNTSDPLRIRSSRDLRLALQMQRDFDSTESMYTDLAAAIAEGQKVIPEIEAKNAHFTAEEERIQSLLR